MISFDSSNRHNAHFLNQAAVCWFSVKWKRALSVVSEYSALRAGIFKASGAFDSMWFWEEHENGFRARRVIAANTKSSSGIGLNDARVGRFANQSPFGVSPGTNRSGRGKPAGPGLRWNAVLRVR